MYTKLTKKWILSVLVVIEKLLMDDIKSNKIKQIDHLELVKYVDMDKTNVMEYFLINDENDINNANNANNADSDSDSDSYENSNSLSIYITPNITMNDFLNDIGYDYLLMIKEKHGISQESFAESDEICLQYTSILLNIIGKYLDLKTKDIINKRLFITNFINKLANIVNDMEYFNIFDNKNQLIIDIGKIDDYNDWRHLNLYPNMMIKMYESNIQLFNKITMIRCSCKHNYCKLNDFPVEIVNIILFYLLLIS